MKAVIVDDEFAQKLSHVTSQAAFCGANGKVLGQYFPEAEYAEMLRRTLKNQLGEEEFARREAESGDFTVDAMHQELGYE